MTPKKKPDTNPDDTSCETRSFRESVVRNAWSDKAILAMIACIQTIGLAWIDYRNNQRTQATEKSSSVILTQVAEIHKSTNSMKDALVKTTEKEALARGGVEERARADEREKTDK